MKPPLRFSLLGLFAAMTIVALAIALYLTSSRLAVAQAEVLRLRQETGHLTIDEVHLIAVPTTDAMHWRWRVYLPGGHDFGIHAHRGTFDKQGWPGQGILALDSRIGGQTDPNLPREILLDVSLDKTLEGNACLRVRENDEGANSLLKKVPGTLPTPNSEANLHVRKVPGTFFNRLLVPCTSTPGCRAGSATRCISTRSPPPEASSPRTPTHPWACSGSTAPTVNEPSATTPC